MSQSAIADLIVAFHFGYVLIVVFGLFIILLGGVLRWRFFRNFWFRAVHLAMILVVVFEAIFGISCPLTDLEYDLRIAAGQYDASPVSFIARLIHKLIFYEFPEIVFTIGYCLFGLAVLVSWRLIPPLIPWKQDKTGG
jgi:heme A synthase